MAQKKDQKPQKRQKTVSDEEQKWRIRTTIYILLIIVACMAAGQDFTDQWEAESVYPSFALTRTKQFSDYLPELRGTRGDAAVYIYEGRQPGGTLLIIGGTHPNEPASNLTATLIVENLHVDQGRILVITRANNSGFTATEPQEGFPQEYFLENRRGDKRRFRVGSRFTNILDDWPDPVVYRHYPSGQVLSGNETRNLNRAYPGRENGTMTERVAYAITEMIRQEKVDLVIDLHEAAPEYPVINAIVAHERAMDIAAMASVDLQIQGLEFRLEPSPANFHGLSHRELGDFTDAKAVLFESAGAMQGRMRGVTNADLVIKSVDPCYHKAYELGQVQVDFPPEGIPLEVRVGRHLAAINTVTRMLGEFEPEIAVSYSHIPDYDELQEHGVGFYLK